MSDPTGTDTPSPGRTATRHSAMRSLPLLVVIALGVLLDAGVRLSRNPNRDIEKAQ